MKLTFSAMVGLASLIIASTGYAVGMQSREAVRINTAAPMEAAGVVPPEYVTYEEKDLVAIAQGCRWVRLAVYDSEHHLVAWRGDPVGTCP